MSGSHSPFCLQVRVHGAVTSDKMQAMKRGCTINGVRYKGMQVTVEQRRRGKQEKGPANTWLNITCTEGKVRALLLASTCIHFFE
jgi:23S rRNA pseudouridine2605 synthase